MKMVLVNADFAGSVGKLQNIDWLRQLWEEAIFFFFRDSKKIKKKNCIKNMLKLDWKQEKMFQNPNRNNLG